VSPSLGPADDPRKELGELLDDPASFLSHPEPELRRLAVSACADRVGSVAPLLADLLESDPDPGVRAEAAEMLGYAGIAGTEALDAARDDPEPDVVEAVVTAYGEIGSTAAVPWLVEDAARSEERLVQEAAVAALGAIGDQRALPLLLELVADGPPQVRRRSVVALTAFDDPRIEPALRAAARDRNPGVREAAEMVGGRQPSG